MADHLSLDLLGSQLMGLAHSSFDDRIGSSDEQRDAVVRLCVVGGGLEWP